MSKLDIVDGMVIFTVAMLSMMPLGVMAKAFIILGVIGYFTLKYAN